MNSSKSTTLPTPGAVKAIGWNGHPGFATNYPLTNPQAAPGNPSGSSFNAGPGYYTYPGPFPPDVIFRNDIRRTDEQFGVFGEIGIDLSDQFSLTLGARNYEIEVDLEGSANSSFGNFGANREDQQRFGSNLSQLFAPGNTAGAPDKAVADGTIFKATLDWQPAPGRLYYVTPVGRISARPAESSRRAQQCGWQRFRRTLRA